MWKLDKPDIKAGSTFRKCISRVRNPDLKSRLESVCQDIVVASEEYNIKAELISLNEILPSDNVGGVVSVNEMKSVYSQRMVGKNSPGRRIYDEIISSPKNGVCPFCGHRIASTLDHYLPKSRYPSLTVAPLNLIPSCSECNRLKLDSIPDTQEDLSIHPYYDNIEDDRWLYAEVIEVKPASISFYVKPPIHWSEINRVRIGNHFELLELNDLYISQAAQELTNIRYYLAQLYNSAGPEAVRDHLVDMTETRIHANINSWQSATYEAWSANDWFVEGGFDE